VWHCYRMGDRLQIYNKINAAQKELYKIPADAPHIDLIERNRIITSL